MLGIWLLQLMYQSSNHIANVQSRRKYFYADISGCTQMERNEPQVTRHAIHFGYRSQRLSRASAASIWFAHWVK